MILYEYQAKKIFFNHQIPIPTGYICNNLNELVESYNKINKNFCALKCQIKAGGRGKADAIKITNDVKEIKYFTNKWLNKYLVTKQTNKQGELVEKILIEEADYHVHKELYFSILNDFSCNSTIVVVHEEGGIEIEKTSKKYSNKLYKIKIDPFLGPQLYQGRILAHKLKLKNIQQINKFTDIFMKISHLFFKLDCSLIEINPLIITKDNNLICLDIKMNTDENANFRQVENLKKYNIYQSNIQENIAKKIGINYISLEGNIGCLVNGAGLAMSTMDMLSFYGGKPANFLDIGGGINKKNIQKALELILMNKRIKSILINIFGGIVRCDFIADSLINSIKKIKNKIPIIVRFEGNNSILALNKLNQSNLNIITSNNVEDAIKISINAAKGNL